MFSFKSSREENEDQNESILEPQYSILLDTKRIQWVNNTTKKGNIWKLFLFLFLSYLEWKPSGFSPSTDHLGPGGTKSSHGMNGWRKTSIP